MIGYAFINRMIQGWQDKPWIKLGDTCPYWMGHRRHMHQPEFAKDALFGLYCNGRKMIFNRRHRKYPPKRGGCEYRHAKLYKLYWRLHGRSDISGGER